MSPANSLVPIIPVLGLFDIDTTDAKTHAPGATACGVSYESPPYRNATSSQEIIVVLRNIILGKTEGLPAVMVRTTSVEANIAARGVN